MIESYLYGMAPITNMIGSAAWQNASINTVNTYDQYKRLTNIAVNGANVYGYTLNYKNQRTSATLPDGNKWNYTYDVMRQLTGAVKQDTANNPLANMNYFYDLIGNRTSATENFATTTYTCNLVNQYTSVNAVVPVYDLDGNMTRKDKMLQRKRNGVSNDIFTNIQSYNSTDCNKNFHGFTC